MVGSRNSKIILVGTLTRIIIISQKALLENFENGTT
jgi:hypothetical protein